MRLRIENCDDIRFIFFLIRFLKKYILANLDIRKLYHVNELLNESLLQNDDDNDIIDCKHIVIMGANNIVFKRFPKYYEITINERKIIPDLDAKLCDICRLINYGSLSIQGYPLFSDAFNYVAENLEALNFAYLRGF